MLEVNGVQQLVTVLVLADRLAPHKDVVLVRLRICHDDRIVPDIEKRSSEI